MSTSHAIRHIRITPIAFRDPPLLSAADIHEPWALRSIIELETGSGLVGINLAQMRKYDSAFTGAQPRY
jgi:glucarate dehydratase